MKTLDEYLAHFGVKGMKWGVRKDDSAGSAQETSSDVKRAQAAAAKVTKRGGTSALDNSELQALVNRMNLEQQYSTLSSKTQTKSLGTKFLQGTGKFAGSIAREQAKNAANLVLKQQVKKALKAKGLID